MTPASKICRYNLFGILGRLTGKSGGWEERNSIRRRHVGVMKLPAVPISRDGVSKRNCAVAKPAFALTSYGAVHLALLSGRSLWRRLIIPAAPSRRDLRHNSGGQVRCAPTSCTVFGRRRTKILPVSSLAKES